MNNSLKTSLRRFAAAIQLAHSRDVVGRAKANREVMGLVGPLVEELEGRLAVQSRYIMHPRASSYTRSINRKDRLAYGKFRAYAQEVKISLLLGEKEEKEAECRHHLEDEVPAPAGPTEAVCEGSHDDVPV